MFFIVTLQSDDDTKCYTYRNVQVTLQILAALIEKLPRDLPLYAPYVLRILGNVLRSRDIGMVEDSIPTFEAFCAHQEIATLAADQEQIAMYEQTVRLYASYAARNPMPDHKPPLSQPQVTRCRAAGLRAIASIAASEAVGADGGKQMNIIMPLILDNLHPTDQEYLVSLHVRAESKDTGGKDTESKRRPSVSTVQAVDATQDGENAEMCTSTDDADRLAEIEVGLLAMKSLKTVFSASNRLQVRLATAAFLGFICRKSSAIGHERRRTPGSIPAATWATTLTEIVSRWAPVQDRFVILVTAVESLVRSPTNDENLEQQFVLLDLIRWLLRSNLNMIGLSVMDVLLGLIQRTLSLLQLGPSGLETLPLHEHTGVIDLFQETAGVFGSSAAPETSPAQGDKKPESVTDRKALLGRMQGCIGDLATHIYYSEQISDMISAILTRLKPSTISGIGSDVVAIENPEATANAISTSANINGSTSEESFSFGTARVLALKAVRQVLITANRKGLAGESLATGRARVGVHVWEGTQWLVRDDDRRVRKAYADALLTWLSLEMSPGDLRVMEDKRKLVKGTSGTNLAHGANSISPKAAINAHQRKPSKSGFLQLLHLAIYDKALESTLDVSDLALLHLVLTRTIEKLGVNAAKTGLPMILRLQECINNDLLVSTPEAKINIGSVVHGYLMALTEKFEVDTTRIGHEIQSEISRRQRHGLWLEAIRVPPLPIDEIMSAASLPKRSQPSMAALKQESIKPFDSLSALVEQIAIAYATNITSPPTSPPTSPGRSFSVPILAMPAPRISPNQELPANIKEAMLAEWTKEKCIAAAERENARTVSLAGSRAGTNHSFRQKYLGVDDQSPRNGSPSGIRNSRQVSPHEKLNNGNEEQSSDNRHNQLRHKDSGQDTGSHTPRTGSGQNPTLRVDELKKVLAGGALVGRMGGNREASPLRRSSFQQQPERLTDRQSVSSGSESEVTAEGFESASEGNLSRNGVFVRDLVKPQEPAVNRPVAAEPERRTSQSSRPGSRPRSLSLPRSSQEQRRRSGLRPPSSSSSANEDPITTAKALRGDLVTPIPASPGQPDTDVPPVPPLPNNWPLHAGTPVGQLPHHVEHSLPLSHPPHTAPLEKIEAFGSNLHEIPPTVVKRPRKKKGVDVSALLGSIDAVTSTESDRRSELATGIPPY